MNRFSFASTIGSGISTLGGAFTAVNKYSQGVKQPGKDAEAARAKKEEKVKKQTMNTMERETGLEDLLNKSQFDKLLGTDKADVYDEASEIKDNYVNENHMNYYLDEYGGKGKDFYKEDVSRMINPLQEKYSAQDSVDEYKSQKRQPFTFFDHRGNIMDTGGLDGGTNNDR